MFVSQSEKSNYYGVAGWPPLAFEENWGSEAGGAGEDGGDKGGVSEEVEAKGEDGGV